MLLKIENNLRLGLYPSGSFCSILVSGWPGRIGPGDNRIIKSVRNRRMGLKPVARLRWGCWGDENRRTKAANPSRLKVDAAPVGTSRRRGACAALVEIRFYTGLHIVGDRRATGAEDRLNPRGRLASASKKIGFPLVKETLNRMRILACFEIGSKRG